MQLKTIIIRNIHSYIFNDLHFLIDDFITSYYDSAFAGSSHWGHFLAQFQVNYLLRAGSMSRGGGAANLLAPETIMRRGLIEKNKV